MYKNLSIFLYDGVEFQIYVIVLLIKLLRSGDKINVIFTVSKYKK